MQKDVLVLHDGVDIVSAEGVLYGARPLKVSELRDWVDKILFRRTVRRAHSLISLH